MLVPPGRLMRAKRRCAATFLARPFERAIDDNPRTYRRRNRLGLRDRFRVGVALLLGPCGRQGTAPPRNELVKAQIYRRCHRIRWSPRAGHFRNGLKLSERRLPVRRNSRLLSRDFPHRAHLPSFPKGLPHIQFRISGMS